VAVALHQREDRVAEPRQRDVQAAAHRRPQQRLLPQQRPQHSRRHQPTTPSPQSQA